MVMSNVVQILKESPNLKRTKYNSIAKVRKWDDTYLIWEFFFAKFWMYQIHSRTARTTNPLNFLLFNFCNNYLFVEVSNNKIFPWGFHDKREIISGFHDDKKVEEHWSMW